MPPKRKRNAQKAPARPKRTGRNATTSIVDAGPSVENGSSVDSADAAPPPKKTRNTGTTPTPRAEMTTEGCTDTTMESRENMTTESHANMTTESCTDMTNAFDEPIPQIVQNPEKTRRSKSSRPDPYTTLPAKTTSYVKLRFQLMNFANVYRIVQLPVTFTFANLHTLIQYMFGWSNSHLHRAEVVSHVVMHDPNGELAGTMKRWGRKPMLGEYLGGEEEDYGDRISWRYERDDNPIYHVDEYGVRPEGFGEVYAKSIKDYKLKLDSWTVHISCDAKELFYDSKTPINTPFVVKAQGAPPIEHAPDDFIPGEEDANDKTVSDRIFVPANFELYCEGKLMSCARRTELAIYTPEEEAERQKRLQRQREERMEVDSDEDNYDDDGDSGEWY
ncbi:hypothetical protein CY34DRAFT_339830 [Suillus luteus UH-Slu-Lm8-n1]|uniref:Plasmid pRiA4b Orf3-like domain-containing protein n=1 Tax=Suillus luteus UH-Slu-Lm8-n1 TaxID=930992 RepID=A0A0D0B661_9AGAM|nr:hypothetical protein CY34DRAFT_339830 [Suillus luteus UH-Slu-Lm8-n1]